MGSDNRINESKSNASRIPVCVSAGIVVVISFESIGLHVSDAIDSAKVDGCKGRMILADLAIHVLVDLNDCARCVSVP